MGQILNFRSLSRSAPAVSLALGAVAALLVAVLPEWRLEPLVAASGLGEFLTAARPPLGATARSVIALIAGVLVAGSGWAVVTLAGRLRGRSAVFDDAGDVPVLRRADAHPDAPPRRPLRASEDLGVPLGAPLPIGRGASPEVVPEVVGERVPARALPADLDTPLAAVDPAAIPKIPREPVRVVAPLARPAEELDRIETFELTPVRRSPTPAPTPAPRESVSAPTSLAALLDRLEQGSVRRGTPPVRSIEDTLGMLRGLAVH